MRWYGVRSAGSGGEVGAMIGMGFKHHAKREARREGGVCVLWNPIDGSQEPEMERDRAAGEGLVSVQGQGSILKWMGVTTTQLRDPWGMHRWVLRWLNSPRSAVVAGPGWNLLH